MKKIVLLLAFVTLGLGLFGGNQTHASNCQEMVFNDAVLCVGIQKNSSNSYTVFRNVTQSSNALGIACDILLPNGELKLVGSCNGTFSYNGNSIGTVKLYVKVNNQYKTLESQYNFNIGQWTSSRDDNDDWYNSSQLNNFSLSKYPSNPNTYQRIDVTIRARNSNNNTLTNYNGIVDFSVQYRTNNSSSRQNAPSSYYSLDRSSYNFSTRNNGQVTLDDLVRFTNNNYQYRLVVRGRNTNVTDYLYLNTSNNDSNYGSVTSLNIIPSTAYPNQNQRLDITVEAVNSSNNLVQNYAQNIRFVVEKRIGNTWYNASSSDYDLDRTSYTFNTRDNGSVKFYDLVRFRNQGTYRLKVYQYTNNNISDTMTFIIGTENTSTNLDNFFLSKYPSNPNSYQWIDVTIRVRNNNNNTLTNYNGTVDFSVQYRNNNNYYSSRQNAPSSYYSLDRSSYNFSTWENGQVTLNDLVRFTNNNYEYRLVVRGRNTSVTDYLYLNTSSNNNNTNSLDNFGITAYPSSPNRNQRADISIRARNNNSSTLTNYNGIVDFYVQYRTNNSSSRQNAPSSYYSLDRSSYSFSTWDNGYVTLNDLVRFTNDNYNYRLVVRGRNTSVINYWYVCYTSNCNTTNNNNNNAGFSSSERSRIQGIHTLRPSLIDDLESQYSVLRFNSSWQNTQENLYEEMGKIAYGGNSIYNNYSSFYSAFLDWYSQTIQLVN